MHARPQLGRPISRPLQLSLTWLAMPCLCVRAQIKDDRAGGVNGIRVNEVGVNESGVKEIGVKETTSRATLVWRTTRPAAMHRSWSPDGATSIPALELLT